MIYYLVAFVMLLFSFYTQTSEDRRHEKILLYLGAALFILVGAFRNEVGADWDSYENLFENTSSLTDLIEAREEKLFMVLLYALKLLQPNYHVFVALVFALSFLIKFHTFTKLSPDVFLSLLIYSFTLFLIYDLNGLRQGIAMSVLLFSLNSILERKLIHFLLLITAATLLHTSAIVFLPFYWLSRIHFSHKTIGIALVVGLAFALSISSTLKNSQLLQTLLATESLSHYSSYLEHDDYNRAVSVLSIGFLQRVFIFLMFLFSYEKLLAGDDFKQLLLNGYFISLMMFILFSFNAEYAARISFHFKSLEMFMIPLVVWSQDKIRNRVGLLLMFFILSIVGMYRILEIPNGKLIPYESLLF